MKPHILFSCVLLLITSCVFTWKAETTVGEVLGYIALLISMVVIGKSIYGKLNA